MITVISHAAFAPVPPCLILLGCHAAFAPRATVSDSARVAFPPLALFLLSPGFMLGLAASNQNNSECAGKIIPTSLSDTGTKASKLAYCCPLKVLVSELRGEKCQVSPCMTGDAWPL